MRKLLRFACLLGALGASSANAATIFLGVVSFDTLIPSDGVDPGVNAFNIANLTGDPGGGGSALPPDFPVFTSLTFLNASLTLFDDLGNSLPLIALGDIGPGFFDPTGTLTFPDTSGFSRADFSATLSSTVFSLSDSTPFTASSSLVTATLLPLSGPLLTPGIDFALTSVSDDSVVPEPASWAMLAVGLVALLCKGKAVGNYSDPRGVGK